MMRRTILATALLLAQHSLAESFDTAHRTARDIFEQLIEMHTSPTGIGTTAAVQAIGGAGH